MDIIKGKHGDTFIAESISVGGEKHIPYRPNPDETWLAPREIEAEVGVSFETAKNFGLRVNGNRARRRHCREWVAEIRALAKRLK